MSPSDSPEYRLPLRSRWRNVHSGRVDTILRVGHCANLGGELRVWLKDQEAKHPNNGWALDGKPGGFFRCWEMID